MILGYIILGLIGGIPILINYLIRYFKTQYVLYQLRKTTRELSNVFNDLGLSASSAADSVRQLNNVLDGIKN